MWKCLNDLRNTGVIFQCCRNKTDVQQGAAGGQLATSLTIFDPKSAPVLICTPSPFLMSQFYFHWLKWVKYCTLVWWKFNFDFIKNGNFDCILSFTGMSILNGNYNTTCQYWPLSNPWIFHLNCWTVSFWYAIKSCICLSWFPSILVFEFHVNVNSNWELKYNCQN